MGKGRVSSDHFHYKNFALGKARDEPGVDQSGKATMSVMAIRDLL